MVRASEPPNDATELASWLEACRPRLLRMIDLRLDARLRSRVDAADVVQETFIDALRRFHDGKVDARMPFFVWVRFLATQKLLAVHREHAATLRRGVDREEPLDSGVWGPNASAAALGAVLADSTISPSQRYAFEEERARVTRAIERLKPLDREILALRHFEQLTNGEAAHVLELPESTAAQRYLRALERLRVELEAGEPR